MRMNKWTQGMRVFNKNMKLTAQNVCIDSRGVEHHVDVNNGHLYHYYRSSTPVDGTWLFSAPQRISSTPVVGTPTIFLTPDGNLRIWACRHTSGKIQLWAKPDDFPDLAKKKLPVLTVRDGQLCYGDGGKEPIILVGNSWRQILHVAKGIRLSALWPPASMAARQAYGSDNGMEAYREYMERVKSSGQNYVRHDAFDDIPLVLEHCTELYHAGIIVELTLGDRDREHFGSYRDLADAVAAHPNVVLELENEFLNDEHWVDVAKERAEYISKFGAVVSGGAWGFSHHGKELCRKFHDICSYHNTATVHRGKSGNGRTGYPPMQPLLDEIKEWAAHYPVLCNELLYDLEDYPSVPKGKAEFYIRAMIGAGACAVNIYRDEFELAGRLAKEFNP